MNRFEHLIQKGIKEAEAGLEHERLHPRLNLTERKRIQREHRKPMVQIEVYVQTYRVIYTLACGHRSSFTLSRRAFAEGKWKTRRIGCWQCADEIIAKTEAEMVKRVAE